MLTLVIGGAASGKSAFAESLCLRAPLPRTYLATMQVWDAECAARVAKHRAMRAEKQFNTVECPLHLDRLTLPRRGTVLLEDLGNLAANELYDPDGAGENAAAAILRGIENIAQQCENLILVSNEVFSGGADYAGDTDRYLRTLAAVNNAAAARADAVVRVVPYGCITMGQRGAGELVDFAALAPDVVGFSDDGRGVQSDELMEEAMRRAAKAGRPVVAHCEVDDLLRGGYIHDGEYCRAHGHKGICSESEWKQVERDIALAEKTGCQYHVCHVSTKESVELVRRAKARGVRVSCETAPHYLLLCDEDLQEDGRFKMNPPLRSREDRAALIAGVADGTIEVIATDHAPHTAEEKSRGLAGSAMGIVGLECAFPLMYKYMVLPGTLTLEKLVALMSDNPRRIFGLGGGLNVGGEADFTVLALGAQYEIDPAAFLSKGRATPFAGWPVQGRAVLTVVGGREAYMDETMKTNK